MMRSQHLEMANHILFVGSQDGVTKSGVGWHCKVCDCFLRDSLTYLDHINGRKHQKNLGFSMRVERSTQDQVSSRLAMLAKEKEKKKNRIFDENAESFDALVMAKDAEAQKRKEERAQERKERRKWKKLQDKNAPSHDEERTKAEPEAAEVEKEDLDEEAEEDEEINPDIAAMMGFSGFK